MSIGRRGTPAGEHRCAAGLLGLDGNGEELGLSVSDDGAGLPEDHEARGARIQEGFKNMRANALRQNRPVTAAGAP